MFGSGNVSMIVGGIVSTGPPDGEYIPAQRNATTRRRVQKKRKRIF